MEAAHAGHAPPDFDDDEFAFGGRSVYTDHTHGTYSQQPLKHLESYNMSELPLSDPYGAAGVGAGNMAGIGNAGIGAAGLNRSRSTTQPYNAFAGPGLHPQAAPANPTDPFYATPAMPPMPEASPYPMYGQPQGNPQASLLEAAGLAAGTGAAASTAVNLARGPSQHQQTLSRHQSSSGARTLDAFSTSDQQHAPPDPYYQQQQYPPQPAQPLPPSPPSGAFPNPHAQRPVSAGEDPYAGYAASSPSRGQFAVSGSPEHEESDYDDEDEGEPPYAPFHGQDPSRASMGDEEDYGYGGGRRVLKVRCYMVLGFYRAHAWLQVANE